MLFISVKTVFTWIFWVIEHHVQNMSTFFQPYLGYRRDHPSWPWDNFLKLGRICSHSNPLFASPGGLVVVARPKHQKNGPFQCFGIVGESSSKWPTNSGLGSCVPIPWDEKSPWISPPFVWFFQAPKFRCKSKYLVDGLPKKRRGCQKKWTP